MTATDNLRWVHQRNQVTSTEVRAYREIHDCSLDEAKRVLVNEKPLVLQMQVATKNGTAWLEVPVVVRDSPLENPAPVPAVPADTVTVAPSTLQEQVIECEECRGTGEHGWCGPCKVCDGTGSVAPPCAVNSDKRIAQLLADTEIFEGEVHDAYSKATREAQSAENWKAKYEHLVQSAPTADPQSYTPAATEGFALLQSLGYAYQATSTGLAWVLVAPATPVAEISALRTSGGNPSLSQDSKSGLTGVKDRE